MRGDVVWCQAYVWQAFGQHVEGDAGLGTREVFADAVVWTVAESNMAAYNVACGLEGVRLRELFDVAVG